MQIPHAARGDNLRNENSHPTERVPLLVGGVRAGLGMRLAPTSLEVSALMRRLCSPALLVVLAVCAARADVRLSIPKRTKPSPVQQLNRDGVRAVQKRDYAKAKRLFYKAYLLDPNDPFTLNNLGYIAELDGELDRAQRYYALAAELSSDAT